MANKNGSINRWYFSRLAVSRASHPGIWCARFASPLCWLLTGLLLIGSPVWAKIKEGDILVVDQYGSGTNGSGTLMKIDPTTGQREIISDFGNPGQGRPGSDLMNVAVDADGWVYVTERLGGDPARGSVLFEVDPETGNRNVISNFGQGNIQGSLFYGLDVDKKSQLLANNFKSIVRINPDTDTRTRVTDLKNPAQGAIETDPDRFITDLVVERSGKIIIGTARSFLWTGEFDSAIFRVHPVTGKRKLLSDFSNPLQGADILDLWASTGLAIEASGHILASAGYGESVLLRIHPKSGKRTVLSDFSNPEQGDLGCWLHGLAIEKSGAILAVASTQPDCDRSAVYRIDPQTGHRITLSDSDIVDQGPVINGGTYMAVVPKIRDGERHECERERHDRGGERSDHGDERHGCHR